MFVVIQAEQPQRRSVLWKLRDRLGGVRLQMEPGGVIGGEFLLLRVVGNCRPSDWEEIAAIVEQYHGRVLLPQGLQLPEELCFPTARFPQFERRVMVDTACELVQRSDIPMYLRIAGLIDPDGSHRVFLRQLLKYYSCVRVVTDNLEDYTLEAEALMQELGAPVLIGCDLDSMGDCVLILSPGEWQIPAEVSLTPPLMTVDSCGHPGVRQNITALRILPPDPVMDACPEGISHHHFAAALYEYAGVDIGDYVAAEMLYGFRQVSLTEAVRLTSDWAAAHRK